MIDKLFYYEFNGFFLFRKSYYALDDVERETLRRERRRLQEQLRRVKRNEQRYHQYDKQAMLFQIQQENLALIHSTRARQSSSTSNFFEPYQNQMLSNLELNLSDDESSSSITSTLQHPV
jgi:hypothetical protein